LTESPGLPGQASLRPAAPDDGAHRILPRARALAGAPSTIVRARDGEGRRQPAGPAGASAATMARPLPGQGRGRRPFGRAATHGKARPRRGAGDPHLEPAAQGPVIVRSGPRRTVAPGASSVAQQPPASHDPGGASHPAGRRSRGVRRAASKKDRKGGKRGEGREKSTLIARRRGKGKERFGRKGVWSSGGRRPGSRPVPLGRGPAGPETRTASSSRS